VSIGTRVPVKQGLRCDFILDGSYSAAMCFHS
jgi:hypothetical protein